MKVLKWGYLIALLIILSTAQLTEVTGQTAGVTTPAVTVLELEGTLNMSRPGWREPKQVLPGTLITAADTVFSENAELQVMCPDGSVELILPTDLLPVDTIRCDVDPSTYIVGTEGERRVRVTRGGREDPTIPYLVAPRATVVSTQEVILRWYSPLDVLEYGLTVRADGDVAWSVERISPADVVDGEIASLALPLTLERDIAYTVEICVVFEDLREGCTSDPGWAAGADTAFYYEPAPTRMAATQRIASQLSPNDPKTLYATAVLLSQTVFEVGDGLPIGYYDEAIQALNRIFNEFPESALANSPETYNLLGNLYYSVNLPRSSARNYQQALDIASFGTEAAANAALGRARTAGSNAIEFYDLAVENYAELLNEADFQRRIQTLCDTIGDLCIDLAACRDNPALCS